MLVYEEKDPLMTPKSNPESTSVHARCRCAPDLLPDHCHRCSARHQRLISWKEAECADAAAALSELHDAAQDLFVDAAVWDDIAEPVDQLLSLAFDRFVLDDEPTSESESDDPETETDSESDRRTQKDSRSAIPVPAPMPAVRAPGLPRQTSTYRLSNLAWRQAKELNLDSQQITSLVDNPEIQTPDAQGNALNHYRDGYLALVDDRDVISVIIHEIPDTIEPWQSQQQHRTQPKAPSGGPGRKTISSLKEMLNALSDAGFITNRRDGGHYQTRHPDHPDVSFTFPSSASDHRSWRNSIAEIKRSTGIDLRCS